MRQVNMTSLGDDAREALTIAGLEKAKERSLEQRVLHKPGQYCVQVWISTCERRWTRAASPRQGNWCRVVNVCLLRQSWTRESEVSIP